MAKLGCAWYIFYHYGLTLCFDYQHGTHLAYGAGEKHSLLLKVKQGMVLKNLFILVWESGSHKTFSRGMKKRKLFYSLGPFASSSNSFPDYNNPQTFLVTHKACFGDRLAILYIPQTVVTLQVFLTPPRPFCFPAVGKSGFPENTQSSFHELSLRIPGWITRRSLQEKFKQFMSHF